MPAPSLAALFDFETQIEAAVVTALAAVSVTAYASHATGNMATPYCGVSYIHGGPFPSGNPRLFNNGSTWREDFFQGTLQVSVITDRKRNESSHSTYRGKVRNALYLYASNITGTELPYLSLMELTETGTQPNVSDMDNLDLSIINWSIRFAIKSTAWPS